MTKPSLIALWLRYSCAALMVAAAANVVVVPGHAQQVGPEAVAAPVAVAPPAQVRIPAPRDPKNLDPTTNGLTLIHGNYCGVGSRPGPPIDALDVACMHHDACTPTGGLPNCDCNARLLDEAAAVARDPRQPVELQSLASMTATAASVMLCKPSLSTASASPSATEPAPVPPTPVPSAAAPAEPVSIAPAMTEQPPAANAPLDIAPRASSLP